MAFKLLTGLAVLHTAIAQQGIPLCLQACLTQVGTNLCADNALSKLTPCLSTTCNNPASTQNLIASLDVAFSPKAEYACQQAYGPANADKASSAVTLPLDGTCATSPYGFKSFLPVGVSRIKASNGCRVMLFSEEDCLGEAAGTDIGTLSNGQCVFRGGRSARLTCRNELDAARAYIQTSCGKDDGDDEPESESSSSSAVSPSSSRPWGPGPISLATGTSSSMTVYPSSAPYHGPGPTSSGRGDSSSIPFHWPFSSDTAVSTGTALTDTADAATGTSTPSNSTSGDYTPTLTLPSASATATTSTDTADATRTSIPSSASGDYTPALTLPSGSATAIASIPTSGSITLTPTLPSASAPASGNGSSSDNGTATAQNGTQTSVSSPDSQNTTDALTLTLTGTPTAGMTSLPTYTGLAARFNGGTQMSIALGLVGAGFALFL